MTSRIDADLIEKALLEADVASLCSKSDLQRMAQAVLREVRSKRVQFLSDSCPKCTGKLSCFPQKAVDAWVLDTSGFVRVRHCPKRCRRRSCDWSRKTLWGNFVTNKTDGRLFFASSYRLPDVFMVTPRFGVTRRWYRQFCRRLLFQYSSFWGEAAVHARAGTGGLRVLHPTNLRRLIAKAWFFMRMIERAWNRGQTSFSFRMDSKLESVLGPQFKLYYAGMRQLRGIRAGELGLAADIAVIDGHQKLSRRTCWVQRSCLLPFSRLGGAVVMGCPDTPARGCKLCSAHAALADRTLPPLNSSGEKLVQLNWVSPFATSLDQMLHAWVGYDHQQKRRIPVSDLPDGHLQIFQSRAANAELQECDEPPQEVSDEMTLQELLDLECKTHKMGAESPLQTRAKKRRKTARRSGGFLVACTPEGFVLDAFEFMGAESCSQRYLFLARVKDMFPGVQFSQFDEHTRSRV